MKHILVTTDFSTCSTIAFPLAIELQRLFSARLTIGTVVDGEEEQITAAQEELESLQRELFKGVPARGVVIRASGDVTSGIVHYAGHNYVDLIILASHGRSGLERMMFGSIAEAIVRKSPCPILVVPAHPREQSYGHEGVHIVVTTDLSQASEAALPMAKQFIDAYGSARAHATLLHIAENMLAATFDNSLGVSEEAIHREIEAEAQKRLEELQARYFRKTIIMDTVLRGDNRSVVDNILEYLASHEVDILVVASHGHTALEDALLGSVAEKLVRLARTKVLVIPRNATEIGL